LVNLDQGLGAAPTEAEVCSLSTFSEATLLREEAAGRFPKPVRIAVWIAALLLKLIEADIS
jgi:predicted DNA-binding transcriptional regulator AlpA